MKLSVTDSHPLRSGFRDMGAVLAVASAMTGATALTMPCPSDGGGDLAFTRYTADQIIEDVYTVETDGTGLFQVTTDLTVSDVDPSWSPDGEWLAFHRAGAVNGIWIARADGTDLQPVPNTAGGRSAAWSPDGDRIAFARTGPGPDTELYVIDLDGTDLVQLTLNRVDDLAPAWSPDGASLVFTREAAAGEATDLWRVDDDGSDPVQIVATPGWESSPDWSPDGTRIAYYRWDAGDGAHLRTIAPDGTGDVQVTNGRTNEYDPAWSPDGTRIAFVRGDDDELAPRHVWTVAAAGGDEVQVTDGDVVDFHPDWRAAPGGFGGRGSFTSAGGGRS
ncbi:MAG: hypothetical protein ACFCVF_13360 [Kineosporiaceae bacterium]